MLKPPKTANQRTASKKNSDSGRSRPSGLSPSMRSTCPNVPQFRPARKRASMLGCGTCADAAPVRARVCRSQETSNALRCSEVQRAWWPGANVVQNYQFLWGIFWDREGGWRAEMIYADKQSKLSCSLFLPPSNPCRPATKAQRACARDFLPTQRLQTERTKKNLFEG